MQVYFTPEFLQDLRESNNFRFVKQVINHVVHPDGTFREDKDDHRYHTIKNAWIRYVSKKKTAFRVIYIKTKDAVYLYRAGLHAIEDKLKGPNTLDSSMKLESAVAEQVVSVVEQQLGIFLKTYEPVLLYKVILHMSHIGHHMIYLISPFITTSILSKFHSFGRFLDRAVEEGSVVTVITRPPKEEELGAYKDLAERDILVFFSPNLHTKLYLFDVDRRTLDKGDEDVRETAILGSANLTEHGLGFDQSTANDELCYRLPPQKYTEAQQYADKLIKRSTDYETYAFKN